MTKLRIPLTVEAVAVFKVGDDNSSIANATRRFLDQQQGMNVSPRRCWPVTSARSSGA